MPDQRTNVVEVALGSRFFLELDLAPFFGKLAGGEGVGHEVVSVNRFNPNEGRMVYVAFVA
jgi:hypothetical protein